MSGAPTKAQEFNRLQETSKKMDTTYPRILVTAVLGLLVGIVLYTMYGRNSAQTVVNYIVYGLFVGTLLALALTVVYRQRHASAQRRFLAAN